MPKKEQHKRFRLCYSLELGYPDSNQKRQDQNLQCYHYTIPQCFLTPAKVKLFFELESFRPIIFSKMP